jgi:hypothetical protein
MAIILTLRNHNIQSTCKHLSSITCQIINSTDQKTKTHNNKSQNQPQDASGRSLR